MINFMTYNMTIMMVNIHEAKAKLSALLKLLEQGHKIYICKRNIPIAELRPVQEKMPKAERPVGGLEGKIGMEHFDDPLWDYPLPKELPKKKRNIRPLGAFKGQVDVDALMEPLDQETMDAFLDPKIEP
jgi:antitoxin (DNA-binding transcriptional repressor) of toxin-antitoxin stability system